MEDQLDKTINTLLTEANNRSRWYSSQLWQLPFAYIGGTAVTIAQFMEIKDGHFEYLDIVVSLSAILGGIVCWHMLKVRAAKRRAIYLLIHLEEQSGLTKKYRAQQGKVALPMIIATFVATFFYANWAIALICKSWKQWNWLTCGSI